MAISTMVAARGGHTLSQLAVVKSCGMRWQARLGREWVRGGGSVGLTVVPAADSHATAVRRGKILPRVLWFWEGFGSST